MNDLKKTIHYTTNINYICNGLDIFLPTEQKIIEPFVGNGDFLEWLPNHSFETYDVDPGAQAQIFQDTLKNPPSYKDAWVATNPPFLAKNKAQDKTIFSKWKTDDLYKAFLLSLCGECLGGIVILPLNFFTDENTGAVRQKFLSTFKVDELRIFLTPVFNTTTYSVCSFAFHREENMAQKIPTIILPEEEQFFLELSKNSDYRVGGEEFSRIASRKKKFSRLVGATSPQYITHIKLYGLDTRAERFHLSYEDERYEGKMSDRIYATMTCARALSKDEELYLIDYFNTTVEQMRSKYHNLIFTNYRDFNRKRVGFDFVYSLLSEGLEILENSKK